MKSLNDDSGDQHGGNGVAEKAFQHLIAAHRPTGGQADEQPQPTAPTGVGQIRKAEQSEAATGMTGGKTVAAILGITGWKRVEEMQVGAIAAVTIDGPRAKEVGTMFHQTDGDGHQRQTKQEAPEPRFGPRQFH